MSQPDPTMLALAKAAFGAHCERRENKEFSHPGLWMKILCEAYDLDHGFSESFIELVIAEAEDVRATHDSLAAQASILPDPRETLPVPTKNQAIASAVLSLELWIA